MMWRRLLAPTASAATAGALIACGMGGCHSEESPAVDACHRALPVRAAVVTANQEVGASSRLPLRPPVMEDRGGPVQRSPRWVPVFFADDPLREQSLALLSTLGCSEYWQTVTSEYGVGGAVLGAVSTISTPPPAAIDDTEISAWLVQKIAAGELEAPSVDTSYIVFYPESTSITMDFAHHMPGGSPAVMTSCTAGGFAGYHWALRMPDGTTASYVVVPRCSGPSELQVTLSHELIESATNPDEARPAFGEGRTSNELTDLCWPRTVEPGLARSFSNRASAQGHDPCVPYPAGGSPYFAAELVTTDTFEQGGVRRPGVFVAAGTTVQLDVRLYADVAVTWTVSLRIFFGGSVAQLDGATGRAADRLSLSITTPADAPPGSTELLVLDSVAGSAGPDGAGSASASGQQSEREFFVRH